MGLGVHLEPLGKGHFRVMVSVAIQTEGVRRGEGEGCPKFGGEG